MYICINGYVCTYGIESVVFLEAFLKKSRLVLGKPELLSVCGIRVVLVAGSRIRIPFAFSFGNIVMISFAVANIVVIIVVPVQSFGVVAVVVVQAHLHLKRRRSAVRVRRRPFLRRLLRRR